jgi:hypothetical protein
VFRLVVVIVFHAVLSIPVVSRAIFVDKGVQVLVRNSRSVFEGENMKLKEARTKSTVRDSVKRKKETKRR